jgi:hypothetical protein
MGVRVYVVLAWLLGGLSLSAQSWDGLKQLKAGDRVSVLDNTGKEHKGMFTAVSADAISLETGKGQESVERPRVRRVEVRSSSRRMRNVLIGVAVGVAVGVTVDQTLGAYFRNETGESGGARAISYVAPIAAFGGLGALPANRTVYRAR